MAENSNDQKDKAGSAHKEEILEDSSPIAEEVPAEDGSAANDSEISLADQFAQLQKDHLYLRAEMENIKRQNFKERSQLLRFGAEKLARDLLDTLDVFRSALASEVTEENFKDFVNGVKMTSDSLKAALEKHGIKEMDCVGKPFDPNSQEALSSEPSDDFPEGHVTQVFKPPYLYHDKLLRAGQVIVSRKKTE